MRHSQWQQLLTQMKFIAVLTTRYFVTDVAVEVMLVLSYYCFPVSTFSVLTLLIGTQEGVWHVRITQSLVIPKGFHEETSGP